MFNCVIDVKDNYFRHGLFILLNETLAEYYVEQGVDYRLTLGDIVLRDAPNPQTQLVFIDAVNTSFRQAFERMGVLNPRRSPTIFIILKSRHVRRPRGMVLSEAVRILYKDDETGDIKHKIRAALIPWALTNKVALDALVSGVDDDAEDVPLMMLTKSERVVVALFEQGFTGKDISQILSKSEKTVSGQKRSAMRKLGVHSDVALFRKIH